MFKSKLYLINERLDKLESQAHGLRLLLNYYQNPPERLKEHTTELELWWRKEPINDQMKVKK